MLTSFEEAFRNKRVLVTGHTGFKGSWLSIWLKAMGAELIGYSLPPPTDPSLFELARLKKTLTHIEGDVRDDQLLAKTIDTYQPEIVFHMAAQSLVLPSYDFPKSTFDINAGGTVNLLEACRGKDFVKAIVVITTDKCYENKEWLWGYRENEALGGHDPYSASKAMAEIAAAAYRKSFFSEGSTFIATARAGNVIGGGDFSPHRLMPDIVNALLQKKPILVRNRNSVRPWIHVLDPLFGYLLLAKGLIEEGQKFAEAWNFGPLEQKAVTVEMIVEKVLKEWGEGDWIDGSENSSKAEMNVLRLSSDKAANQLGWRPAYDWEKAIEETAAWAQSYRDYLSDPSSTDINRVCQEQILTYMNQRKKGYEISSGPIEGRLSCRT